MEDSVFIKISNGFMGVCSGSSYKNCEEIASRVLSYHAGQTVVGYALAHRALVQDFLDSNAADIDNFLIDEKQNVPVGNVCFPPYGKTIDDLAPTDKVLHCVP